MNRQEVGAQLRRVASVLRDASALAAAVPMATVSVQAACHQAIGRLPFSHTRSEQDLRWCHRFLHDFFRHTKNSNVQDESVDMTDPQGVMVHVSQELSKTADVIDPPPPQWVVDAVRMLREERV